MPQNTSAQDVVTNRNADLQLLIFTLAGEEYALGLTEAREIIQTPDITPVPNMPEAVKGVSNLRGRVLTVIDLTAVFGLQQQHTKDTKKSCALRTQEAQHQHVIIIEKGDDLFGLLVDNASEVLRTNKENFRDTPEMLESIAHADSLSGVIVLEEQNRMVLRINIDHLLASFSPMQS